MNSDLSRFDYAAACQSAKLDAFNEEVFNAIDVAGVVVVQNALNNVECDDIVREMWPFIETTPHGLHGLAGSRRVGALVARSVASHKAIAHPAVLQLCEFVLGEQRRSGNSVKLMQAPRGKGKYPWRLGLTQIIDVGPGQEQQNVHRGNGLWVHDFSGTGLDPQVETMWALTDFTHDNGATHVIPGSHQWPDVRGETDSGTTTWFHENRSATVQATMPKGSVLIWTGWTVHGAGANRTKQRRIGMNIDYSLSFLSQEENQFLACPPEVAKHLSTEMRRLIGYTQPAGALNYFADCLPPRYALMDGYDVMSPGAHGFEVNPIES